jgi:hypothetical protein
MATKKGNDLSQVTTQNGRQGIVGKGGNFQPLGAAALGRVQAPAPAGKPVSTPTRTPPIMAPGQVPQPPGEPRTFVPPSGGTVNQPAAASGTPGLSTFMPPPSPPSPPMTFSGAPGATDYVPQINGSGMGSAEGGAGNIDNAIGSLRAQLQQAGAQMPAAGAGAGGAGLPFGGKVPGFGADPGSTPWMPPQSVLNTIRANSGPIGGPIGPNMHGGGLNGDQAPASHGGGGPLGGTSGVRSSADNGGDNWGPIGGTFIGGQGDRMPGTFNPQPTRTPATPGAPTGAGSPYLSMLKARLQGGGGSGPAGLSGLGAVKANGLAGGQQMQY